MTKINKEKVSALPFFKGLPDEFLANVADNMLSVTAAKGKRLFTQGDDCGYIWFVLSGEVKVYKEYASGKSAVMGLFGAGAMIAEVAVIDANPYPASALAVVPSTLVKLPAKYALKMITTSPVLAHRMMNGLSKKLRKLTADLASMSVLSVIRRLARFLQKLAVEMGQQTDHGVLLQLALTRKDIAECIGTSFEVVVRSLGKLQADGILESTGKKIIIKDMAALEAVADSGEK